MTVLSRGQPSMWDSAIGTKHIVYEAFCADGTCLPPVIFTSCEKVQTTQHHLYNPGPTDLRTSSTSPIWVRQVPLRLLPGWRR